MYLPSKCILCNSSLLIKEDVTTSLYCTGCNNYFINLATSYVSERIMFGGGIEQNIIYHEYFQHKNRYITTVYRTYGITSISKILSSSEKECVRITSYQKLKKYLTLI